MKRNPKKKSKRERLERKQINEEQAIHGKDSKGG